MKTKIGYLVLGWPVNGRKPVIRRSTQSPPKLEAGEAFVRVELDLPDDFFTKPVHTLEISSDESVVAVQADLEPEPEPGSEQ